MQSQAQLTNLRSISDSIGGCKDNIYLFANYLKQHVNLPQHSMANNKPARYSSSLHKPAARQPRNYKFSDIHKTCPVTQCKNCKSCCSALSLFLHGKNTLPRHIHVLEETATPHAAILRATDFHHRYSSVASSNRNELEQLFFFLGTQWERQCRLRKESCFELRTDWMIKINAVQRRIVITHNSTWVFKSHIYRLVQSPSL